MIIFKPVSLHFREVFPVALAQGNNQCLDGTCEVARPDFSPGSDRHCKCINCREGFVSAGIIYKKRHQVSGALCVIIQFIYYCVVTHLFCMIAFRHTTGFVSFR